MNNTISTQSSLYPIQGWLAIRIFCCFALAYLLSYGLRVINAVIAPHLMNDLGISNSTLGAMSSAYFIGFFFMQLPLGHWLDKYGSRKSEGFLLLFAVAGSIIFALADSIYLLALGNGLVGIGVSACLMAAFTFYARWFKPELQSSLASAMLICGTAGAMLTTIPVQMALPLIGWRGVFWVIATLLVISVIGIQLGIPRETDPPALPSDHHESNTFDWIKAYLPILKNGRFLQVLPMALFNQGGYYAIQTLWLGNWFRELIHLSQKDAANHLFIFNVTLLMGFAANLLIPRLLNKKGISTFNYSRVLGGLALLFQILALFAPPQYASICLFLFGLFGTSFILGQLSFIQFFPKSISGKASNSFNILIFGGAILIQWGVGVLIDVFIGQGIMKVPAFQLALGMMLALQAISYLWLWLAPLVLHPSRFLPPTD